MAQLAWHHSSVALAGLTLTQSVAQSGGGDAGGGCDVTIDMSNFWDNFGKNARCYSSMVRGNLLVNNFRAPKVTRQSKARSARQLRWRDKNRTHAHHFRSLVT